MYNTLNRIGITTTNTPTTHTLPAASGPAVKSSLAVDDEHIYEGDTGSSPYEFANIHAISPSSSPSPSTSSPSPSPPPPPASAYESTTTMSLNAPTSSTSSSGSPPTADFYAVVNKHAQGKGKGSKGGKSDTPKLSSPSSSSSLSSAHPKDEYAEVCPEEED